MWFLRIAEELSNVVLMWFLQSQRSYEELSNMVPANRRGAAI